MSSQRSITRTILLVSCAHAMVHLFEQSVGSVEKVVSSEFSLSADQSGWMLGTAFRWPYGFGALFAGLLADRFGPRRVLLVYLIGGGIVCGLFQAAWTGFAASLLTFLLGCFASIYHPAGLACLANATTPAERSAALGTHGIFGSLGIAAAPFFAAAVLHAAPGAWRGYYLLLATLAIVLAAAFYRLMPPPALSANGLGPGTPDGTSDANRIPADSATRFQLVPYCLLIAGTALAGIVYGGVLHFLGRYLSESAADSAVAGDGGQMPDNLAAAIALVCGAFGQWLAGRIGKQGRLPLLLSLVYLGNIPFLIWMVHAEGRLRLIAACLWAFVHFMSQPLYNSLVAEFMPRHRRSVLYGISNLMGFGIGSIGPALVGWSGNRFVSYEYGFYVLAGLAGIASLMPLPILSSRIATRESSA